MRPHYLRPLAGTTQAAMLAQALGPRLIRSIQRGVITFDDSGTTGAATINAVDLNYACVSFNGASIPWNSALTAADPERYNLTLVLTNKTTVTATLTAAIGGGQAWAIPYEVIEFWPGAIRSLQTGTITIAVGAATGAATVVAVNMAQAFLIAGGMRNNGDVAGILIKQLLTSLALTAATTVTATRGANGGGTYTVTIPYTLVEC